MRVLAACGELGAPPRRLDGLNATRMQLDEIMDKYVREETKKQEEAHKLVGEEEFFLRLSLLGHVYLFAYLHTCGGRSM